MCMLARVLRIPIVAFVIEFARPECNCVVNIGGNAGSMNILNVLEFSNLWNRDSSNQRFVNNQ